MIFSKKYDIILLSKEKRNKNINKFNVIDCTEDDCHVYEFQCVSQLDANTLMIVKKFEDINDAEKYARDYCCAILHNVKIQHRVKKVVDKKLYK